jgi:hypothetical protein
VRGAEPLGGLAVRLASIVLGVVTKARLKSIQPSSSDGFFGKTKMFLQVHGGLTQERRYKIIQEILEK